MYIIVGFEIFRAKINQLCISSAVCRLPPKRVVVGGGSEDFLQGRREALQRWLTLTARHPVLAYDADLRAFLCEVSLKLDKPRHDEFLLAGTIEIDVRVICL